MFDFSFILENIKMKSILLDGKCMPICILIGLAPPMGGANCFTLTTILSLVASSSSVRLKVTTVRLFTYFFQIVSIVNICTILFLQTLGGQFIKTQIPLSTVPSFFLVHF